MATIASLNVNVQANTATFIAGMKGAAAQVSAFSAVAKAGSAALSGLNSTLGLVGVSLGSVFAIKSAVMSLGAAEQASAQLNATLKSMGGTAGLTADEIGAMATSLAETTNFTKSATVGAAALLGTFSNIKGAESFKAALVATQNLATKFGGDLSENAVRLGKALQDPVAGMVALRKVGVTLDDQQKAQIKTMMKAGDVLGHSG